MLMIHVITAFNFDSQKDAQNALGKLGLKKTRPTLNCAYKTRPKYHSPDVAQTSFSYFGNNYSGCQHSPSFVNAIRLVSEVEVGITKFAELYSSKAKPMATL